MIPITILLLFATVWLLVLVPRNVVNHYHYTDDGDEGDDDEIDVTPIEREAPSTDDHARFN